MERLLIIATCSVSVARPDLVDITNLTGAPTAAQIQYSSPLLEHVLERVRQRSGIKDWGSNGLNLPVLGRWSEQVRVEGGGADGTGPGALTIVNGAPRG